MNRWTRKVPAWALAGLWVTMAGCDSENPLGPFGDTTAPVVSATNPIDGATGVAVITASFNESMDASTINTATFLVHGPGAAPVVGTVGYQTSSRIATFTPAAALVSSTTYSATVSTGVQDAAGNALAAGHVWTFTTSATAGSPAAPVLGGAGAFVVLAGSTVTNSGPTVLSGDLGVSPGTAVTGFPPGTLSGSVHAGDATAAAAMADLTAAYDDASARTLAPITVAGNLGGLTLPPGLYKSTSSLAISSGDLTLDAKGDANAVFIFQVASTLTTSSGRSVTLSGGAKAANVYWQVGSSVTLGTTSGFKGTLMADQSITLDTGATLEGRALARIGAVTLASNAVVSPAP